MSIPLLFFRRFILRLKYEILKSSLNVKSILTHRYKLNILNVLAIYRTKKHTNKV